MPPARLAALRTAVEELYAAEGAHAGWEQPAVAPFVRRLCNLFSKGDLFVELATDPLVLDFAELVIGRPVRWHAMNAHDPLSGHRHPSPGDPCGPPALAADARVLQRVVGAG